MLLVTSLLRQQGWAAQTAKAQSYVKFVTDAILPRYRSDTYFNNFPGALRDVWDERASHYGVMMAALFKATRND